MSSVGNSIKTSADTYLLAHTPFHRYSFKKNFTSPHSLFPWSQK